MHVVLICLCAYPGWLVLPSAHSCTHYLLVSPAQSPKSLQITWDSQLGCQLREGGLGMAFMLSSKHFWMA